MTLKISVVRAILVAFCLLIAITAWMGFRREYSFAAAVEPNTADSGAAIVAATRHNSLPMSVRSLRNVVHNCADFALNNPSVRVSVKLQQEANDSCHATALQALKLSPIHADAHALALLTMPNLEADSYRLAQAAGAFEPWPLNTRLAALGKNAEKPFSAEITELAKEDIARALQSDWSRRVLAGLYIQRTPLSEIIRETAATRPDAEQRAFLSAIRRLSEARRG